MLKKNTNELMKSYVNISKNNSEASHEVKGCWEWNKLHSNRNLRIDAWKNSR